MLVRRWRLKSSTMDAPRMSRQLWGSEVKRGSGVNGVINADTMWSETGLQLSDFTGFPCFFPHTSFFFVILYYCLVADFWFNF